MEQNREQRTIKTKVLLDLAFELGKRLKPGQSNYKNYKIILKMFCKRLDWDYGEIWFADAEQNKIIKSEIYYLDINNVSLRELHTSRMAIEWEYDKGAVGHAWAQRTAIWIDDFQKLNQVHSKNVILNQGIKTGIAVPVFCGDYITSVIFFMSRQQKKYDAEQIELVELMADRLGMLLFKLNLESEIISTKLEQQKSLDMHFSSINVILQHRDPYTVLHQQKVAEIAERIAIELNMPAEQIDDLVLAAQLHDVGKIAIPLEILNKSGKLTKEEFALIKTHVDISYDIISILPCSDDIKRIIREHHERDDGSGYPNGLKNGELLYLSKIIIVADVMSSMMEDRPYRTRLKKKIITEELLKGKGTLYNSKCIDVALEILEEIYDNFIES